MSTRSKGEVSNRMFKIRKYRSLRLLSDFSIPASKPILDKIEELSRHDNDIALENYLRTLIVKFLDQRRES